MCGYVCVSGGGAVDFSTLRFSMNVIWSTPPPLGQRYTVLKTSLLGTRLRWLWYHMTCMVPLRCCLTPRSLLKKIIPGKNKFFQTWPCHWQFSIYFFIHQDVILHFHNCRRMHRSFKLLVNFQECSSSCLIINDMELIYS